MRLSGGGLSGEGEQVGEYLRWVGVVDNSDGQDGQDLRLI